MAFRLCSADRTPIAPHIPVPKSTTEAPTRAGASCPVIDMRPLYACMSGSYPGWSLSGPVGPYAVTET